LATVTFDDTLDSTCPSFGSGAFINTVPTCMSSGGLSCASSGLSECLQYRNIEFAFN
jgi:hypothetical protein